MRCLNTKGKYGKVTNTAIKWSIITKSVMMVIFVEFIDQLVDCPINRASLSTFRHERDLAGWSVSSLDAFWIAIDAKFLHADNNWLCWGLTARQLLWVILSPREREKRDRSDSRGDEREGQGRKRKMKNRWNKNIPPSTLTCCKDSGPCPNISQSQLDAPVTQDTRHHSLT